MANMEHLQVMSPDGLVTPSGDPTIIGPGIATNPPSLRSTSSQSRPMSFHAAAIEPPTDAMRAFATQHPIPHEDISMTQAPSLTGASGTNTAFQDMHIGRDGSAAPPGMLNHDFHAAPPGVQAPLSALSAGSAALPGAPTHLSADSAGSAALPGEPHPSHHHQQHRRLLRGLHRVTYHFTPPLQGSTHPYLKLTCRTF